MRKSAVAVGMALLGCNISLRAGEWQKLPPLPEPNAGFVCGLIVDQILVIGGTNWTGETKNWLRTVHTFDLRKQRWSSLAPLDQPVAHAVAGETKEGLVLAGGTTGVASFAGAINAEGNPVVTSIKAGVSVASVLCAGGLMGDKLIFVGGSDAPGNPSGFRREVFALDVRTGGQQALSPHPGPAFGLGVGVVMGDEMFVFGGCRYEKTKEKVVNLAGAHAFSLKRNEWRALQPVPSATRAASALRLDDRHVYLAGGFSDELKGFTDRAFVYDTVDDRYFPAPSLPYRAALVGLILHDGYVYCIGGEDKARHRASEVCRIKSTDLLAGLGADR